MSFFRRLSSRAKEEELMDDFSMGGEELREALRHLRRLNKILLRQVPPCQVWRSYGTP